MIFTPHQPNCNKIPIKMTENGSVRKTDRPVSSCSCADPWMRVAFKYLNVYLFEESLFLTNVFYWQSDKMFHGYFQSSVTTKIIYIELN